MTFCLIRLTILVCRNHVMCLLVVSRCKDFNQAPLICPCSLKAKHEVKYKAASVSLDVTEA